MNDMNRKVEDIYKKYFSEKINYSDTWKERVFNRLEHGPVSIFSQPSLKYGLSLMLIALILVTTLKVNQYYSLQKDKAQIVAFLSTVSAENFITYENYSTIITDIYIKSASEEIDYDAIYDKAWDSLYLYWTINHWNHSEGKKYEILTEAITEVAVQYIENYSNSIQSGLI